MRSPTLLLPLAILAFSLQATPPREGFQVEDLGLSLEQMEDKLLALPNEERGRHGLPALARDPSLRAMAREHCGRMIAAGRLAHDLPGQPGLESRAAAVGLHFSKVGENVARSATSVVRFFHEALMASPAHRENILDRDYTHLGVGIAQSGGIHYAAQEFARLYEPVPAAEMERRMEERIAGRFPAGMALSGADRTALRDHCRLASRAFLNGATPARLADAYGSALIVTLAFTEAETGFLKLLQEIKGITPLSWSQGVAFARSPAYPGGAFALTLVLFTELRSVLQEGGAPDGVGSGRLSCRRHAVYQSLSSTFSFCLFPLTSFLLLLNPFPSLPLYPFASPLLFPPSRTVPFPSLPRMML